MFAGGCVKLTGLATNVVIVSGGDVTLNRDLYDSLVIAGHGHLHGFSY